MERIMKESKKRKKRTLKGRFIFSLVLFAVVISLSASAIVGFAYYDNQEFEFGEIAFAVARTTANHIDGDKIQGYLDTKQKDEHYEEIQNLIDSNTKEFGLKYHYVFAPVGNDYVYIWDAGESEALGVKDEELTDEELKELQDTLKGAPEEFYISYTVQYGLCGTAFVPLYDSSGKTVAVVGVDYSMPAIISMIMIFSLIVTVLVVIVTTIGGIIFYRSIKKRIIKPIVLLNNATEEMVSNIDKDVEFNVDIHTGDELETLADSFGKMDKDLRTYIRDLEHMTAEKERIGAELNIATQIQADMLPRIFPAFPEREDIDIYASMTPAKEVGGDFYDFFLIDDNHIGLVMADVSGKGVPAALFMVIAKTLIKNRVMAGDSPADALSNVNEQLCEGNEAELFVTVWLSVIDLRTGKGMAANAGHEHPAIRRANGEYELEVYRHSLAVAAMEGVPFEEHEFQLNPGDSIFVYTDGVAEATNAQNELYGTERMMEALNKDSSAKPDVILENVKESIDDFVAEAEQFDDITMLCFKYIGPKSS